MATAKALFLVFMMQPNQSTRDASTATRLMQSLARQMEDVSSKPISAQIAVLLGSASTADPTKHVPSKVGGKLLISVTCARKLFAGRNKVNGTASKPSTIVLNVQTAAACFAIAVP